MSINDRADKRRSGITLRDGFRFISRGDAMDDARQNRGPQSPNAVDLDTTASLLSRVRDGDRQARERLVSRYLPALKRWARGRLPHAVRDFEDTDDLVQITLLRALDRVGEFESRREGAFHAYLRTILQNAIRDRFRRAERRPPAESLSNEMAGKGPSPLESAIGAEALGAYETALGRLTEEQREAVILRIELGFTHGEVAAVLGSRSANASRMLVTRGLVRLAEIMNES